MIALLLVASLTECAVVAQEPTAGDVRQVATQVKSYCRGLEEMLTHLRTGAEKAVAGRTIIERLTPRTLSQSDVSEPYGDALRQLRGSLRDLDEDLEFMDNPTAVRMAMNSAFHCVSTTITEVWHAEILVQAMRLQAIETETGRGYEKLDTEIENLLGSARTARFEEGNSKILRTALSEIDQIIGHLSALRMYLNEDAARWASLAKSKGADFVLGSYLFHPPRENEDARIVATVPFHQFLHRVQNRAALQLPLKLMTGVNAVARPDLQRDADRPGLIWMHKIAERPLPEVPSSITPIEPWNLQRFEAMVKPAETSDPPEEATIVRPTVLSMPPPQIVGAVVIDDGIFSSSLSEKERQALRNRDKDIRHVLIYGIALPQKREEIVIQDEPGVRYKLIAAPEDWNHPERRRQLLYLWRGAWSKVGPNLPMDPELRSLVSGMILEAQLDAAQLAGIKRLKINGLDADWILPTGMAEASIRLVRRLPIGEYEESDVFYTPELVHVQVETRLPLNLETIPVVLGRNENPLQIAGQNQIMAKRVGATVYRTDPILIMLNGQPRADLGNVPHAYFARRDKMQAILSPEAGFAETSLTYAQVWDSTVIAGVDWRATLVRAATAMGISVPPNILDLNRQTAEEFASRSITDLIQYTTMLPGRLVSYLLGTETAADRLADSLQYKRVATVTVGDLAAMLLLRGTFVAMSMEHVASLRAMTEGPLVYNFAKVVATELPDEHPFSLIPTVREGRVTETPLKAALKPVFTRGVFQDDLAKRFVNEFVPQSVAKYIEQLELATSGARTLPDKDIKELIKLTGAGFGQVERKLLPRLMRIVDDNGNRLPYWQPDPHARAYVQGLGYTAQVVRAYEKIASADTQLMLSLASLLPVLAPASLVRTVLSITVGLVDIADLVINQIPEYFQRNSEYQFATRASALLDPHRVTQAKIDEPSAYGTVLAGMASLIGLRFDIADAARAVPARQALDSVAAFFRRSGNPAEALSTAVAAQRAEAASAISSVITKRKERGHASLTPQEQQIWLFVEEVERLGPDAAWAARRTGETILEYVGDVAPGMAKQYRRYDNAPTPRIPGIQATGAIGQGQYCTVWEYIDVVTGKIADRVLKVVMQTSPSTDLSTPQQVLARMLEGEKLLKDAGIPYKGIIAAKTEPIVHFFQERLPEVSDTFRLFRSTGTTAADIPREMQEAIVELYSKLAKKQLVWTDGLIDNIYLERIGGKWVAGVLDTDLIFEYGKAISNPHLAERARALELYASRYNIWSVGHLEELIGNVPPESPLRIYESAEIFMAKMLEFRGLIRRSPMTGQWEGTRVGLDIVEKHFPGFRNYTPVPPPLAGPGLEALVQNAA